MTKTIVITGASDGVGAAAARRLGADGHRVVVVGRSARKSEGVAKEIGAPFLVADFADLHQVGLLADELISRYPRIDVLANNAGGIMGERSLTVDGFERTFQVNHLAPFLLTKRLLPTLIASQATVIQTASRAARMYARFDIEDLQNERDYRPQVAYGNAKLANILFTKELQRRQGPQAIAAVAFHPGVVGSNFAADTTHFMRYVYHGPFKRLVTVSPERGAAQLIWLAEGSRGTTFTPGQYYESKRVATRVNRLGNDPDLAKELWERSEGLLKEIPSA